MNVRIVAVLLVFTVTASAHAGASSVVPVPGIVNINTATVSELQYLPGIGAVMAARIAYTPHYDGAVTVKPSELVREIVWHSRIDDDESGMAVGIWGEIQPSGARPFTPQNGELTVYLFDDEVDSDVPARAHWHTDGGYALQQRWL